MFYMMKKILVIDDNTADLAAIGGILKHLYRVYPVNSGKTALNFLQKQLPDLILLDDDMPEMSGIDFIKIIKSDSNLSCIPVIFLSSLNDTENELRALELGAVDYLRKPVNSALILARLKLHLELESYRKDLQKLVNTTTSQITQLQKIIIEMLSYANERCYKGAGNHVKRTVGYVCAIMNNLPKYAPDPSYHITSAYYNDIKTSAPFRDIGIISIPDSILLKAEPLTDEEYEIMKSHVTIGEELLRNAIKEFNAPSFLDAALEMALTHHEKWDGTGYPNNLKGDKIPLSGRIVALADVYDALVSSRPYRPAFSCEEALGIIISKSGQHFDPVLVGVFKNIQDNLREITEKYS